MSGSHQDISSQKQSEQRLKEALEYNLKMTETSPVSIVVLDKQGQIELGKSEYDDYTVKRTDKGLLGMLPPTLRRAGKQILDKISRDIPTGRITNGRVFPPFL